VMEVGPSGSPCRGRSQTAAGCSGELSRGGERCGKGARDASGVSREGERE
jgi:hypothetical protein